jgi:hypothetical protein
MEMNTYTEERDYADLQKCGLQYVGRTTRLFQNTGLHWAYIKVKSKGKVHSRTGHEGPERE